MKAQRCIIKWKQTCFFLIKSLAAPNVNVYNWLGTPRNLLFHLPVHFHSSLIGWSRMKPRNEIMISEFLPWKGKCKTKSEVHIGNLMLYFSLFAHVNAQQFVRCLEPEWVSCAGIAKNAKETALQARSPPGLGMSVASSAKQWIFHYPKRKDSTEIIQGMAPVFVFSTAHSPPLTSQSSAHSLSGTLIFSQVCSSTTILVNFNMHVDSMLYNLGSKFPGILKYKGLCVSSILYSHCYCLDFAII